MDFNLETIPQNMKRKDYINWDEYFVAMMLLRARQEGRDIASNVALVLNSRQIIIGMANETVTSDDSSLKSFETHAEVKAIVDAEPYNSSKVNCTMYTTKFPCEQCARAIIKNGINKIIYISDKNINEISRNLLKTSGIKFRKFSTNRSKLEIDFSRPDNLPLTP